MLSTVGSPHGVGSRALALPLTALVALTFALAVAAQPTLAGQPVFAAAAFVSVLACCASLALGLTDRLVESRELDLRLAVALALFPIVAATAVTLLGLFGVLRLPPLLGVLGAASWINARTRRPPWLSDDVRRALSARPSGGALLAAALFSLVWLLEASHALRYTTLESDSMWYHLPMVAHWARSGSLEINESIPLIARAYPGLRQAALTALTLPQGNEHLALLGLLELPMFFFALHVALRRAGASPPLTAALACYGASMPVVLQATRSQGTDLPLAAYLVLGLVLFRESLASGSARTAALAGLSLGAASSLKYSGPIYAALIVFSGTLEFACSRKRSEWNRALRPRLWLLLMSAAALVAGPWYVRNLIRFSNPLYPAPFLFFDGPLDLTQFAEKNLGWDLAPLLDAWMHFPRANGWLIALMLTAPVALIALVALRKRAAKEHLAVLALVLLFFVAFLLQPFNRPSFQPYYNMRYLIGWSALLLVALAGVLRRAPLAWLFLAGAVANLMETSRWAALLALVALLLAALFRWRQERLVRGFELVSSARSLLASLAVLGLSTAFVAAAAQVRAKLQYDPAYGYRDSHSDRGWGELGAWVHRNLGGRAIGVHGDNRSFPYYGDRLDNTVVVLDTNLGPAEVAAAAREQQLDYVVCLTPITGRRAARDFEFGISLAPSLLELYPSLFAMEREARGSQLLRVTR